MLQSTLSPFTVALTLWLFVLGLLVFGKNMQHSRKAGTFDPGLQWQLSLLIVGLYSLLSHLSAGWSGKIFWSHMFVLAATWGKYIFIQAIQCSKFLVCTYVMSRLQTKSKVFMGTSLREFHDMEILHWAIWFLLVLTGWDDSCPQQDEPVSSPIGVAAKGKEAEDNINTGDVHAREEKKLHPTAD